MTYASSMTASRSHVVRTQQNLVSFKQTKKAIGPVSNTVMLIVLSCILGMLYLGQVTKTNAFGYKISELNKQTESLRSSHDELEVASARLQSLERVKNSEVAKSLVTVAPSGTVRN